MVTSIAWSPDSLRMAVGNDGQKVVLWGKLISIGWQKTAHFNGHKHSVRAVAWSPDGAHLATASHDQSVRIWPISPSGQALFDEAKRIIPRCLTRTQRETFHLSVSPPNWCATLQKWPCNLLALAPKPNFDGRE